MKPFCLFWDRYGYYGTLGGPQSWNAVVLFFSMGGNLVTMEPKRIPKLLDGYIPRVATRWFHLRSPSEKGGEHVWNSNVYENKQDLLGQSRGVTILSWQSRGVTTVSVTILSWFLGSVADKNLFKWMQNRQKSSSLSLIHGSYARWTSRAKPSQPVLSKFPYD